MHAPSDWIPLLPLKTVLFPGGVLALKLRDTRHIDMMRECAEQERPFGVVLGSDGSGPAQQAESVGCLAFILRSTMIGADVMQLRASGGQRFRTLETRQLSGGRMQARVEVLAADGGAVVADEYLPCAAALRTVIHDLDAKAQNQETGESESRFARPLQFSDVAWVANRWCEILPIPLVARQKLMELRDARSRLTIVHQYLQQHGIL